MRVSNITPKQFKKWRMSRGMSLAACAAKLGISPSSVYNYEEGRRSEGDVKIPVLVAWAMTAIDNNLEPYEGEKL